MCIHYLAYIILMCTFPTICCKLHTLYFLACSPHIVPTIYHVGVNFDPRQYITLHITFLLFIQYIVPCILSTSYFLACSPHYTYHADVNLYSPILCYCSLLPGLHVPYIFFLHITHYILLHHFISGNVPPHSTEHDPHIVCFSHYVYSTITSLLHVTQSCILSITMHTPHIITLCVIIYLACRYNLSLIIHPYYVKYPFPKLPKCSL